MRKTVSVLLSLLMLISLLLTNPAPTRASTALVDAALAQALQVAKPSDVLRVVATFDGPLDSVEQTTLLGIVSKSQALKRLPMALIEGTPGQITQLQALPTLRSLYLDQQLSYMLHESVPLIGADRVWSELGYDGTGATVAVLDSGVDATHPDLAYGSKVVQNIKLVSEDDTAPGFYVTLENVPNSDTSSGHGTHVAGTVGGTGAASNGYFTGVAPGAELVGIGAGDTIFIFSALAGFDWALENQSRYGIDVITNSWGSSGEFDPQHPVNVASKAAHDAGMVILFASGNSGPGTDTLNPYSVAPWVIGVAAGNKDGQTLADFSSRGRYGDPLYHPTITAPGVGIVSTRANNTILPPLAATDDAAIDPAWLPYYTTMSGTSMATPHVAGVVALMLQANPALTPDAVKQVLVDTATPMPQYAEYAAGAGYVNAYAATDRAQSVKRIKQHKTKSGSTIEVYVVEQTLTGSVGPAVAGYNRILATTSHNVDVGTGAVFADTKLIWDNPANDLDLFLFDPAGTQVGASQDIQALSLTALEGVAVDNPAAGTWSAEARGWLNAPQSYTLRVETYFPVSSR